MSAGNQAREALPGQDVARERSHETGFRDESARLRNASPVNAMSVDVEEHFQVSAFEPHVDAGQWGGLPSRVADNTGRILDDFAAAGIHATFFVLGWVAERNPGMVPRLIADGHEVASHGWQHTRATEQTPEQFRADVNRTRALLEDQSGQAVLGYRAASYSIGAKNLWALDVLAETGHRYSSSIYPIRHDLYGMPEAPRFAFRNGPAGILEIPVTTVETAGLRLPCGGGGFFRLFPYWWSRWALRRVNRVDAQPAVFYFHPWEVDPEQPRVDGLALKARFRHYLNLRRMQPRLRRLLGDFRWDRIDRVFGLRGDAE